MNQLQPIQIEPFVQECIQGTNGTMYKNLIGKLTSYPIPEIPIPSTENGLFLDIGVGWGRWMVAAAQKGYIPFGIDIKLESCIVAKRVLNQLGFQGYTVQADLRAIPFKDNTFDKVWSFSVLQHTHRSWALRCLHEIYRTLQNGADCTIEYPMRNGLRNSLFIASRKIDEEDLENSWCVRYYSLKELEDSFKAIFNNFSYQSHCYFGIGILPKDLEYVRYYYKPLIYSSLFLTKLSESLPKLRNIADSLYVIGQKKDTSEVIETQNMSFFKAYSAGLSELEILSNLLCCPKSKEPVMLNETKTALICHASGLSYPVVEGIPIMLVDEATKL